MPTLEQTTPTCKFKTGSIILQQPITHEQLAKLLETGKTDLLDKFISNRTRRAFKAFLVWDAEAGKVGFEFEPRAGKAGAARGSAAAKTTGAKATKAVKAVKSTAAKAPKAAKPAAEKKKRAPVAGTLKPSAELAAVIGDELLSRPQAMKKIWDYIKTHNLQDPKDKRTIVADAKLRPVLGADSVNMFALAGLIGRHVS